MATITGKTAPPLSKGVILTTWTGMATGDTGTALDAPMFPDKTWDVNGTFGGATVTIEGSNDGTNWNTVNDTRGVGNSLTFTAAGIKSSNENPLYLRPKVTGGTGSGISVVCLSHSARN